MSTCSACKHWDKESGGACDRTDILPDLSPEKKFEIDASAADDTNLMARLLTGPDFGCVLFEAKT